MSASGELDCSHKDIFWCKLSQHPCTGDPLTCQPLEDKLKQVDEAIPNPPRPGIYDRAHKFAAKRYRATHPYWRH